jgi:hypothetical protein
VPAPDVYGDGLINPLPEHNPAERIPYTGILYATDRIPATAEDPETYYVNDRGQVVRLGAAEVTLGEQDIAWESARDISMMTTRTDEYPVKIASIDEWGILGSTVPYWSDIDLMFPDGPPPDATQQFADTIRGSE